MEWTMTPGHIIFVMNLFVCIIIGEGIFISKILKNKRTNIVNKGEIENRITFFREFWASFVVYVIATSIIALFIASFVTDKNIVLNDMNTWVSLILGMVALIIGVISLFLSFYNVDQSALTQNKTLEIMQKLQTDTIERFSKLQIDLEHKIEDSGEKTRMAFNGKYNQNGGVSSTVNVVSGDNSWEDQ